LAFVLLIFPWRTFFFLSTLVLLGPQNIAVRKYLERRAREREQQEREEKEKEVLKAQLASSQAEGQSQLIQQTAKNDKDDKDQGDKGKKKRRWGRNRKKDEEDEAREAEMKEAEMFQSPRPAFFAHKTPTRRTQVPRDVAVPYFRFRKDRFYDWPPDPTVSRATPLLAYLQAAREEATKDGDMELERSSTHKSKSRGGQQQPMYGRDEPTGLRNRSDRNGASYNNYEY
jgi:hypothetical protein